MKKKVIIIVSMFGIIGISASALFFFYNNINPIFSSGGRYDDSKLDYMGVIFQDLSDINAFNEGFSTSAACPWGFEHNGIDFFFNNNSNVIAAAPGQVEEISNYVGEGMNKYHVKVNIRFNSSILLGYGFEPWTDNTTKRDQQWSMLEVNVGDWVQKGDIIAQFLHCNESAHIHFDVIENNQRYCPTQYFSSDGYTQMMNLIHSYHPNWSLCYP